MAEQKESINWGNAAISGVVAAALVGGGALVFDGDQVDNTQVLKEISEVSTQVEALLATPEGLTEAQVGALLDEKLAGVVFETTSTDFELDHEDRAITIAMEEVEDEIEDLYDFIVDEVVDVDDEDDVKILDFRDWDVDIESRSNEDYDVTGQVKVEYLDDDDNELKTKWIDFELTIEDGRVKGNIDYDL